MKNGDMNESAAHDTEETIRLEFASDSNPFSSSVPGQAHSDTQEGEPQFSISSIQPLYRKRDAKQFYSEAIIETIDLPALVIDRGLTIIAASQAFCKSFVITSDLICSQPLFRAACLSFAQARLREWLSPLAAQPAMSAAMPAALELPAHQNRLWRVNARRIGTAMLMAPMILLTFDDIAARPGIGRRQLEMLVDAMPGAIMVVDQCQIIQFACQYTESLFGYNATELIGKKIDLLMAPEFREHHAALHAGFLTQPSRRPMGQGLDIYGKTKDGNIIPLDIGLAPVIVEGELLVIAAIQDLRTQKKGESELRLAKAAADSANQAKSRFLAAAGHDLRQPLQTISLLHGLLETRVTDPQARLVLAKLDDAVGRMTELLDTLLDINQIETGAITPEIASIPVANLLMRISEEFSPQADAKGLSLRIVRSTAVIESDFRLLARILGNLVSNAIKYTDQGRILLGCRKQGTSLRIEVWDTGIGIPSDCIGAVFDEFYRVDRSDSSRFGLGIGLYIVQRFAQLLSHGLEVRSMPGKGTMFAIVIAPAIVSATADQTVPHQDTAAPAPALLLVEDDEAQRDVMRMLLEHEGYRVMAARGGDEALQLVRAAAPLRPSLVVSDYNLPRGQNGWDMIQQLRHELNAPIPALIISGDKLVAKLPAIGAGECQFAAKPVGTGELIATINALSEHKPQGTPADRVMSSGLIRSPALAAGGMVAVIDDDAGIREGIKATLEADGNQVCAYASAEAFLADPSRRRFQCVVLDLNLPGIDGLALQKQLRAEPGSPPIVFLSGRDELAMVVTAMREGGADFLHKPVRGAALRKTVARILKAGQHRADQHAEQSDVAARAATLTERERAVMKRIVAGKMNKHIAAELGISQRTAEHYRQNVMRKMGAKSLAMLVQMAGNLT